MKDIKDMSKEEQEAFMLRTVREMPVEDQVAFTQIMEWIAYEKPDDVELSVEKLEQMMIDVKRKNARRVTGQRNGQILRFPLR